MVQPDVKRLVAYSSVSHMGFVVLGIFSFTELRYAGRALSNAESRRFDWCSSFCRLHLRAAPHAQDQRVWRTRHADAVVCDAVCDRVVVVDRAAVFNGRGRISILSGMWTSTAVQNSWIVTMLAATGMIWAAVYML